MLLYVHVPYCRKLCSYCAFYSQVLDSATSKLQLSRYTATIVNELALWHEHLGAQTIETVFFGGGTPSLLPASAIAHFLAKLQQYFILSPHAEITLEANPESALTPGWLADVHQAGVTRISFGIQSFDDATLQLLGRAHTAQQAITAITTARNLPFTSVSLDLMWGLPGAKQAQTLEHWLCTLQQAIALQVHHISTYALMLEPNSLLERQCLNTPYLLPDETTETEMYLQGVELLEQHGYKQYEIANFALDNHICKHNVGYWAGIEYLGLGPAATSTLKGRRWTNPADISMWEHAVHAGIIGTPAVSEQEHITKAIQRQEDILLGLRTTAGISLKRWESRYGIAFEQTFYELMQQLTQQGLAQQTPSHFALTTQGLLVSNSIMSAFFAILENTAFPDL